MEQSRAFCESRVRGRVDGLAERGPGREGVRRLGPLSPASSAYLGLGDLSCLRTRRQRKATQRAPPGGGRPDELEPATPGLCRWLQVFLRRVSHSRTACGLTTVQAASPTHAGAAETHGPESRGLGRGTCLAGCGPEPPAPHTSVPTPRRSAGTNSQAASCLSSTSIVTPAPEPCMASSIRPREPGSVCGPWFFTSVYIVACACVCVCALACVDVCVQGGVPRVHTEC